MKLAFATLTCVLWIFHLSNIEISVAKNLCNTCIIPIKRTHCNLAKFNSTCFYARKNVSIGLVYQLHKIPYTLFILKSNI
ncbi:hypothetical protein CFP56_041611 [Quercus suber]|uniref:Uncharacterized protein n=1 Tax=Quercus suber TaxID=58331 RepID=A0AAW0IV79_QUESU